MKARLVLVSLVVVYVITPMLSCDQSASNLQSAAPAYVVTAEQLNNEYRNNEVAAKVKYHGRILVVEGEIAGIDSLGNECRILLSRGGSG